MSQHNRYLGQFIIVFGTVTGLAGMLYGQHMISAVRVTDTCPMPLATAQVLIGAFLVVVALHSARQMVRLGVLIFESTPSQVQAAIEKASSRSSADGSR